MNYRQLAKKVFKGFIYGILFIFCAIPGAFLAIGGLGSLAINGASFEGIITMFFFYTLGVILVLIGLRKFNKSLYLLPIFSVPFAFIFSILFIRVSFYLNTSSFGLFLVLAILIGIFLTPFIIKKKIDRHYELINYL
jgi:hypothetical protein